MCESYSGFMMNKSFICIFLYLTILLIKEYIVVDTANKSFYYAKEKNFRCVWLCE